MSESIVNLMGKVSNEMDQKIIEFFGSEEAAREKAHLYVLEYLPPQFEEVEKDGCIISYITQESRLRLKSIEELEADSQEKHGL